MKQLLTLFLFSGLLVSCSGVPPVSGTIITEQGEVRVHPDGRVEIVIESASGK